MSKTRKRYSEMNAAELAEATRDFDKEVSGLPGKPLNGAQRRAHRAAKMGRPVKGEGARTVAVSIERGLLKRADALGKRRRLGRSALFTKALKALLGEAPAGDVTGAVAAHAKAG